MAGRIRTIKPEWLEDDIACEPDSVRVASIGLILHADDHGRGRANETILGAAIFPATPEKIRESLARLLAMGFIVLYQVRGQRYYAIRNWERHQKVDRPGKPRVPCPCAEFHTVDECENEILANIPETVANDRETLATDHIPRPHTTTTSIYGKRADQVLEHLNKVLGSRFTSKSKIVARLKAKATVEELCLVVDYKHSQWSSDPKMSSHLNPKTLFRPSHWEDYLDEARQWQDRGRRPAVKTTTAGKPPPLLKDMFDATQ